MTLFLVSDGFFWRQRRQDLDTIAFLNMPPLFLIIIFFFFSSSYLRQAFNTIPNSSVSDTTRHDTIHFFFLSFYFFLFGI